MPVALAERITRAVAIPTIGIGAGPHCDGQVLVLHDLLGVTPGKRPKFSKDFLQGRDSVSGAISAFAEAVRSGEFPTPDHSFL
jgi:3-methyl-2-oxobutanoate hydroxymethyltransferase